MKSKILQWFDQNVLMIECVLVGVCVVCYLLHQPEAIMLSFTTLAVFYFLSGYLPARVNGLIPVIAYRLVGIASAVCINGLLFHLLGLHGSNEMLRVGAIPLAAAGLVLIFQLFKSQESIFVVLTARVAILVSIIAAILM